LIERWFGALTTKRLRRGAFRSVPALVGVIYGYVALNNADPRHVWTASIEAILAKVGRRRAILETAHNSLPARAFRLGATDSVPRPPDSGPGTGRAAGSQHGAPHGRMTVSPRSPRAAYHTGG
jgi:hypothetical protein